MLGKTLTIIHHPLYTEAQKKSRAEIIQLLLKAGTNVNHANNIGETALIRAIRNHDLDAVQILLQAPNININSVDTDGDTPLIIAVQCIQCTYINGDVEQYNNCQNSQKIVEKLLATSGINPHHVNKKGETAITLLKKLQHYY